MFRITERLHLQCTTHTHNGVSRMLYFIISVFPFHVVLAVNVSLKQTALLLSNYSQNVAITPILSMSTNAIEFLQFLAKHCTRLPDDGSSVIRNMLEYF